jgi:hypothetical protein
MPTKNPLPMVRPYASHGDVKPALNTARHAINAAQKNVNLAGHTTGLPSIRLAGLRPPNRTRPVTR